MNIQNNINYGSLKELITDLDDIVATTARRITKDSGERIINEDTGFQRDTEDGKPKFCEHASPIISFIETITGEDFGYDGESYLQTDYELDSDPEYGLVDDLMLNRVQALLERGARKYGEDNWRKGNYMSRSFNALIRHAIQFYLGSTDEGHIEAVIFNAMVLMRHEHEIKRGALPAKFGDIGALANDPERYGLEIYGGVCGWCGNPLPNGHTECVEVANVVCRPHEKYLSDQMFSKQE